MGKPTIRAPKFGKWVEGRRGNARSLESVAHRVRSILDPFGVRFPRSALLKIEQEGRIPHPLILYVLAQVLRVSPSALLDKIANELGVRSESIADLPTEPLPSDRAMALARWFDALHPTRQRAIVDLLEVPDLGSEQVRQKRGR